MHDLRPIRAGNRIVKYADDTYLIVPEANSSFANDELSNIQTWATRNSLTTLSPIVCVFFLCVF